MDFRTPYAIGERIDADYGQLTLAEVTSQLDIYSPSNIEVLACQATCPQTDTLDVYTDEPPFSFIQETF